jgi:hypothetical protein
MISFSFIISTNPFANDYLIKNGILLRSFFETFFSLKEKDVIIAPNNQKIRGD